MIEMNNILAIEVLETEKKCVKRNIDGCCRDCAACDLVLPDDVILSAYDWAIRVLSEETFSNGEYNNQDNMNEDIPDISNHLGKQLVEVLAKRLDGRQYREELTTKDLALARDNGLIIVYGASDDLIEFDGIFCDEFGCYEGGEICITKNGPELNKNMTENVIKAVWCKEGIIPSYSWTYETDIPHSTFNIMDGNEYYCKGIVFSIDDLR